jgi:hypothetical protein
MSKLRLSVLAFTLFSIVAAAFPATTAAQVPDPISAAMVPIPGVGHHYIGMGAETVNPADGSLSFNLPLQPPPGRGLSFPFGVNYSSSQRFTIGNDGFSPALAWSAFIAPPFQLDGWNYELPVFTASIYQTTSTGPQQQTLYCDHSQNYVFRGFDGVQRAIGNSTVWQDPGNNGYQAENCIQSAWSGGSDGYSAGFPANYSGWPTQPPMTVTDASGTTYQFPSAIVAASQGATVPFGFLAQTITDKNGNQITLNGPNGPYSVSGSYVDTLGRQVVSWPGIGGSGATN